MKVLANSKARIRERLQLSTTYASVLLTLPVADENLKINATKVLDFSVFVEAADMTSSTKSFGALYVGIMSKDCYDELQAASETDPLVYVEHSVWTKTPDIARVVSLDSGNAGHSFISNFNGYDVDVSTPFTEMDSVVPSNRLVFWGKGTTGFTDVDLVLTMQYERVLLTNEEFVSYFAKVGC